MFSPCSQINVYPVIYFDIFGDSFGPDMTSLHVS